MLWELRTSTQALYRQVQLQHKGIAVNAKTSLDKSKIKFLLLEGIHPSAVDRLHAAGYSNIETLKGALSDEELKARIAKTIAFVKSVDATKIASAESAPITLKFPHRTIEFTGKSYLTDFVIPNLYFHVTAAYAILRHNGVELGKGDFLGGS